VPADFAGALALNVTETWTNTDGTTGIKLITDNLEAYAPGSPVFAWSGDDTLTGSSGQDLFVFAQPIGDGASPAPTPPVLENKAGELSVPPRGGSENDLLAHNRDVFPAGSHVPLQ
jgi:hypothetical protein